MMPRVSLIGASLVLLAQASCKGSGGPRSDPYDCTLADAAGVSCADPNVRRAQALVEQMTLEEKVRQMSGTDYDPDSRNRQEDDPRLAIPGLGYLWGSRGMTSWWLRNDGHGSTVFPAAAARAASWDLELERRIGKAIAQEVRYAGYQVLMAPLVDPVRHPRWGRSQEAYGEDPFLVGELGAAFVRGAQHDPAAPDPADPDQPLQDTYRVMACAGQLGQAGVEDTKFYANAVADERTQREVLLSPLRRTVKEGVAAVQTAHNRVNGRYASSSEELLRGVLRDAWDFDGFTVSEWFGAADNVLSPVAGLDVYMPFSDCPFGYICEEGGVYGPVLVAEVQAGRVDERYVDEAALRILSRKAAFGVLDHPAAAVPDLLQGEGARALALRAAEEGMVLLENGPTASLADDVLPLSRERVARLAVVGKFADAELTGDKGDSAAYAVDAGLVVTPYEGLAAALGATNGSKTSCGGAARCALAFETVAGHEAAMAAADAIVVVAAYYPADLARSSVGEEGWWKDRTSMALPARDLENIAAAVALEQANPGLAVIVVVKSGGAVVVEPWVGGVDALLMAGYGGMSEGTALGELVFGDVNPSGRLVQSFPEAESDLPAFPNATSEDVPVGYYHGYRWLDREGIAPRYPFGFGQSYTTFEYSNLTVETPSVSPDGELAVTVDVTNTGPVKGTEVVQAYVSYPGTTVGDVWGRAVQELKAFARVADLEPGETRTVTLSIQAIELAYWNVAAHAWRLQASAYGLRVGPTADVSDPRSLEGTFTVR